MTDIKENKRIILIWSASGFQNMGDEAILAGNLEILKTYLRGKYNLIVLSFVPEVTYKIHKVTTKPDFNRIIEDKIKKHNKVYRLFATLLITLKLLFNTKRIQKGQPLCFLDSAEEDFLRTLYNSEAILFVGGGYLNDIWLWGGLIARSIVIFLASKLNKPVFLGAQSIGPLNKWWTRRLIKYLLKRVKLLTLRENFSMEFLEEIGIKSIPIKVVPDDAFNVSYISENEALEILLREGIDISKIRKEGKKIAAVNTRAWWKINEKNIILQKVIKTCIDFLLKQEYFVILVPTAYSDSPVANDVNSGKEMLDYIGKTSNIKLLKNIYTWDQLKGILQCVDCSIGISYHFAVFSFSVGTPVLGLYTDDYYRLKLGGIFRLMGLENLAVDVRNFNVSILETFINNMDDLRKKIIKIKNNVGFDSCYAAKELIKFLSDKTVYENKRNSSNY